MMPVRSIPEPIEQYTLRLPGGDHVRMATAVVLLLPLVLAVMSATTPGAFGTAAARSVGGIPGIDTAKTIRDIERHLERVDERLEENRVGEAREILTLTEQQIGRQSDLIAPSLRSSLVARLGGLRSRADRMADSLIDAAVVELESSAAAGAVDPARVRERLFMDNGLDESELGRVDRAIAALGETRRTETSIRIQAEAALNEGLDPSRIADAEVREVAYELEQARADSIRNAERRHRAMARGEEKLRRQREEARRVMQVRESTHKIEQLLAGDSIDEASTVFGIYEPVLRQHLDPADFERLRARVEAARAEYEERSRWADNLAETIGDRLDEGEVDEAARLYGVNRLRLCKGLGNERCEELAEDVERAAQRKRRRQGRARAAAARIQGMIAEGDVERAHRLFGRHRQELERYLPRQVFRTLRSDVDKAFDTMKNRRRWARSRVGDIEDDIDQERGAAAYATFRDDSAQLAQHLDSATLARLHTAVVKADAAFRANSAKAAKHIRQLHAMLEREEIEEAYRRYRERRSFLRHYHENGQEVEEVGKKISGEYDALLANRRRADRIMGQVKQLIAARQGEKAYGLYQKEESFLADYAAAAEVRALGRAVSEAREEFRHKQREARRTAAKIGALLKRDDAESAHTTFEESRDILGHYLGDQQRFLALQDSVRQAYRALRDSTRSATRVMKEIEDLIDNRAGRRARRLFEERDALLWEYLDGVTVRSLRKRVVAADARYRSGEKEAKAVAGRIEKLLAAGKREEACAAFGGARDDLRHFLDPSSFRPLAQRVKEARAGLRDEQRTALGHVRDIDGLIRRRRGDEAYALFRTNQTTLKDYLPAESYSSLSTRVSEANRDFGAQRATARKTAQSVRARLARDSVEAAYELFRDRRADLRHYLEPRAYDKLEKTVTKPYERRRKDRRKARLLVLRLNWLLLRGKSAEAHEKLAEERELLREYLPAEGYAGIREKVDEAYKEFLAKRREMRGVSGTIHGRLKKGRIEKAHTLYREHRRDLKTYLEKRDYERVTKRVDEAWDGLREKRNEAHRHARSIKWHLWKDEAVEARKELRRHATHLRRYLDTEEYDKLSTEVSEAYRTRKQKR